MERDREPLRARCCSAQGCPGDRSSDTYDRVRTDTIGKTGTVTLRHGGKLYHIGVGRTYAGTHVLLIVQDLHVRIIDAATGELLRDLALDPARNYQPTGRQPGPAKGTLANGKTPNPDVGSGSFPCPERSHGAPSRTRTCGLLLRSKPALPRAPKSPAQRHAASRSIAPGTTSALAVSHVWHKQPDRFRGLRGVS